jgi:threonyl-tRNA synthetase
MEVNFVAVFRVVEDFYARHKADILELVKYGGMPVYIELLSEMKHYWAMKSEFQAIDGCDGFVQLSTVQLDVKDSEIYGIGYIDRDGGRKGCIICHSSIGSIERWMYSILEAGLMKSKPELPYWLSPVQLRIIPVGTDLNEFCRKLAHKLVEYNIRVDVDDREERLGKKIRSAEQDWVPYAMVIGEKERESEIFVLRERGGEEIQNMSLKDLINLLKSLQGNMPFRRLNLAMNLSRQPVFRG